MFQAPLEQFQPFSLTHLIIVGNLTAIWGRIINWSLHHHRTKQLTKLEKGLATVYILLWSMFHGWWLLPPNFEPASSLPIHICDIVGLVMPLSLIWRKRCLIALLYFWGLGFSLQGLLTPDLQMGLLSPLFWLFWFYHATIVGTAVYMIIVHRFRPTRRDYRWAVKAGLIYFACVFPINAIFGLNYGYLGNQQPGQPSLIDWLGPWPWRVGIMVALAWVGMTLLLVPWEWNQKTSSTKL
ncbi:TIGR02206 family membrane protein [Leptolyngbya cf. ectocarpi LEGE 11479]|uniref:TIGR02206 family membrane protein n=1 Tax=Leptolyngbya cf. ectocarpi LEGE 11479 TaxID=1828722 RepID=A0A929A094_LEPEC|nr:TIGR02206 family membrane protein [Leptolyngbya ectocarpi]MBE9070690.1 TIGR02206 family membrane protein [Leptolyngbya cf. ectocarpi LEGE 11479]